MPDPNRTLSCAQVLKLANGLFNALTHHDLGERTVSRVDIGLAVIPPNRVVRTSQPHSRMAIHQKPHRELSHSSTTFTHFTTSRMHQWHRRDECHRKSSQYLLLFSKL